MTMAEPRSPWALQHWEGIVRKEFLVPRCPECQQLHFPPRRFCPHCWADREYDWSPIGGRGTIYSFTEVRSYAPSDFASRLPFVIAIVRLREDLQLLSNVIGSADTLHMDQDVELDFHTVDGNVLPCFRPVGGD